LIVFYPAVIGRDREEWTVTLTDVPCGTARGADMAAAWRLAHDGALLELENAAENGPLPPATDIEKLACPHGCRVALMEFELAPKPPKRDERAIKKTLTLPAWLNEQAEKNHINFSSVLKSALLERLGLTDEVTSEKKRGDKTMEISLYMIQKPGEGNSKHFWSFEPMKIGASSDEPHSRDFILPEGFTIADDGFGGKAAFQGERAYMLCTRGNLPVLAGGGEEIPLHPAACSKR